MPKVVGIDLGTTNSVHRRPGGGRPGGDPQLRGGRLTPSVVAFTKTGERLVGQLARRQAIAQQREHRRLHQALHGDERRRSAREEAERAAVQGRRRAQGRGAGRAPGHGQGLLAGGDLGDDPPEAQGGRREVPGGEGHPGRDHRPGLLQRLPAPGHQERRADRRAGGAADHQRADGRRPGLRAGQEDERRRSWSGTWAGGPSTSPSWRSGTASSRSRPPPGTPTWAGTTTTSGWCSSWPTSSSASRGSTCARTARPCSACWRRPRRPRSSSPAWCRRRSTCPSSPPTRTGPSTSSVTLTRAKFEEITNDITERCVRALPAGPQRRQARRQQDRRGGARRRARPACR